MKKPLNNIIKVLFYIFGGLFVFILSLTVILWIKSPGIADAITGVNGEPIVG